MAAAMVVVMLVFIFGAGHMGSMSGHRSDSQATHSDGTHSPAQAALQQSEAPTADAE